ncbi:unnamed protein product [Heterobilharzia americana]|nr:unnamed protein product [Heterobilharzia americana]
MYLPSGEENEMLLPDPPKDVRVTSIGDTWVLLELADDQSNMHTIHRRDITSGVFRTGLQVEAAEFNASSGWRIMESSVTSTSVHVNGLLPQTGYHFLVRYINRYGVGRPFILNRLVITKMPEPARDYVPTELVVKLQSVSFSPVHIRAISPSELLAEWFLCGPSDTLSLITGFKAAYMSVPMSRCITSGAKSSGFYIKESITHYSKMDHDSCTYRDESVESLLDSYDDDLTPCSLLGISKQQSLDWNPPSFLNGEAFDYYVHSGVNSTNVKMAIGNLRPFMCYAVRIEAFVDHPDHNRIFAQKSQVSVSLTHDSTPTGAPQVTNVYWLKNGTVLQLDWNPPNEWERGGLLTGYSLRILSTAPKLSRTVNMGAEKSSFHIYNLDPSSNYTLYLSAVTCHGEGVRSLPVYIFAYPTRGHFPEASLHSSHNPIIDPNQFESGIFSGKFYTTTLADHTNSKHTGVYEEKLSLTREPWFIVSAVMFSVLWVLICLGLIICGRHRNERQRRRHGVLDVMDVEIIAKNGRLGTSDSTQAAGTVSPSMYMGGFMASTEAEAASLTVVDPLSVNAALLSDRNHTPKSCNPVFGDKSYANGLTHAMNAPYSVSINHTFSMSGDGNLQSVPAYIPQYSLGTQMLPADILKNHPYNNSSTMVPNISASSGGQMLPSGNHCSSDLLQGSGTPILPNGCLSLALSHGSQNQAADLSSEDHATPYASVSVIQQMVFDHMPMDYSAVQQGRGKQLSLAEIIPPPPDYPPPSLPSFSPVPHHFTSWSLGEAPCSGSGEDSAYSDFQQSSQHQGGCGPSVSNHNWLTSQPESNSALPTSSHSLSKTSGLSSEWPNHESLSTPHSTDQHNLFAHHPSTSLSTIQPSHVAC